MTSLRRSTSNPNIPNLYYGRLNEKKKIVAPFRPGSLLLSTITSGPSKSVCHVNYSTLPDSEMLVDKLAAKLVREHATEGHTSRMSHISDLPAMQALMKSNRKRPAVAPHESAKRRDASSKDVGCPTGFEWCRGPQMQLQGKIIVSSKLGSPKGTRCLSAGPNAVAFSSSSQRKSSLPSSTSP